MLDMRQTKLTNNPSDRKDQRDRTQRLINETKNMDKLQETPPKHLVGIARYTWTQIVPVLNEQGWLKQTDKPLVEQLCTQIAIYRDAYLHIFVGIPNKDSECTPEGIQTPIYSAVQDSSGKILEHIFSGYKVNPAVNTLNKATIQIKSLAQELGMTPQARASLLNISSDDDGMSMSDLQEAFGL